MKMCKQCRAKLLPNEGPYYCGHCLLVEALRAEAEHYKRINQEMGS